MLTIAKNVHLACGLAYIWDLVHIVLNFYSIEVEMLDISVKSIVQKISKWENNFTRMLVKIYLVSEWIKDEGDGYQIDSYGGLKVFG